MILCPLLGTLIYFLDIELQKNTTHTSKLPYWFDSMSALICVNPLLDLLYVYRHFVGVQLLTDSNRNLNIYIFTYLWYHSLHHDRLYYQPPLSNFRSNFRIKYGFTESSCLSQPTIAVRVHVSSHMPCNRHDLTRTTLYTKPFQYYYQLYNMARLGIQKRKAHAVIN